MVTNTDGVYLRKQPSRGLTPDRPGIAPAGKPLSPARSRRARIVPVDKLLPADSPRLGGINEEHVRRLAEIETDLPPLLVHLPTMRVVDGMHRLRAAVLNGREYVEAIPFEGTEEELFLQAVKANVLHGLPLSLSDRKAAAGRILACHPQLSDRMVAATTGLAAKTVSVLRHRSAADSQWVNTRLGADGRRYPMNSAPGRVRASQILTESPGTPLRDVARAAGVSVGTAHDVRVRLNRGEGPLPAPRRVLGDPDGSGEPAGADRADEPDRSDGQGRTDGPPQSAGGPGTGSRPEAGEGESVLRSLARDPSLRHTEAGRELLRWLHRQILLDQDWHERIASVPAHCTGSVARLARQRAAVWTRIAGELEQRRG